MNTVNLVLMIILVAMISFIAGRSWEKAMMNYRLTKLSDEFKKISEKINEGSETLRKEKAEEPEKIHENTP